MSGRSILIMPMAHPAVLLPVGLGAGVAALGAGVAAGVKTLVEARIAAAQNAREREKAENQAWRAYEHQQKEQAKLYMAAEQAVRATEEKLAALQLSAPAAESVAAAPDESEAAFDFAAIGAGRDPEAMQQVAAEINALLDSLPAEFREAEGSSFPALLRQAKRLTEDLQAGKKTRPAELESFKSLVGDSLGEFANELETMERQRQEAAKKLGALLEDALFYERLLRQHEQTAAAELRTNLEAVIEQAARFSQADGLKAGQIELLEKKFAEVRAAIDAHVVQLAQRDGLCEGVERNLYEMGYKILAEFASEPGDDTREAMFRIPGGERVQVTLHKNNQLGMQLFHERKSKKPGPLSARERAFFEKQEERWCADFKELVRRLVAEGFPYEISVEEKTGEGAVEVVVVETAEDVIAQDAMQQHEPQQRYMDER